MMLKRIAVFAFGIALFVSCKENSSPEVKTIDIASKTTKAAKKEITADKLALAEFKIEGMTCAIGCAATIQKNLNKMEGVQSAKVDFDKKIAMVSYDKTSLNVDDLAMTVAETSDLYKVIEMKNVSSFEEGSKKNCATDCKKACCKDKAEAHKGHEDHKKKCDSDCKKDCCAKKA